MSKSPDINPDDTKLIEAGYDPAAAPADAIAKLRELRGNPGVMDSAIARALGMIADPGAAAMLAEMEAGASGAIRREVRRALFKLKQHGIDAPVRSAATTARDSDAEKTEVTAMLSPIDGEGARIVWIIKPRMQGGLIRMWALISDQEGLVGAQNTHLSRRELKSERDELERRAQVKLVDGDWRVADFIACEAWRNTPESRRGHVGNFLALRSELIASPPPTELVHPVYAELAAETEGEPSVELLKEPEFLEWRLPDALLKPYVDEINQAGESVIVLSPVHKQERVNAVIDRATKELLTGDNGRRIQTAPRGYRVLPRASRTPRASRMGRGRSGPPARRNRRDEGTFFSGIHPNPARHGGGSRAAEGRRGAAPDHDSSRSDARARSSRSKDASPVAGDSLATLSRLRCVEFVRSGRLALT